MNDGNKNRRRKRQVRLRTLLWRGPRLFVFTLLAKFVGDWRYSRNWRALLASLPVFLVGAVPAVILLIGGETSKGQWLEVYRAAAISALEREDFEASDLYFRRMVTIDESDPSALYGFAQTAVRQEDHDRARSLMRRIAPENAAGHAGAHLWLAKDMLSHGALRASKVAEVVEHHLQGALAGSTERAEAHALLGQLYVTRGEPENAIPHFEEAAKTQPVLDLILSELYDSQGDTDAAQIAARRARDLNRQLAESEPQQIAHRFRWARSEVLLRDYPEAVRILEEHPTSSDQDRIDCALVDVYLHWFNDVVKREKDNLGKQLELLNRAMEYGPDDSRVLALLANLATKEWEQADEARAALQQVLAQGAAPATVHIVLGVWALKKEDIENALMHLELAYHRNPQSPTVLNNLAWGLAHKEEPDLERALKLAEAAKRLSNHPEISDTIGTILVRLGRHEEAIVELEIALRAFPKRPELHGKLAELYDELDDTKLADLHRRLAEPGKKPR